MSNTYPIFYKNIVPLSKQLHGDWSLEDTKDYRHTSKTNSVYIAAIEFSRVASEYPIVFCNGDDDTVFPVAILGLRKDENLYINELGEWQARYIPAYVRRYPFILGTNQEALDQFTVCIDSDWLGFNTEEKGARLFNDEHESDLLRRSIDFLKEYQHHVHLTKLFCERIKMSGILEPMKAEVKLPNNEGIALGGFMGVNREKLKALDGGILLDMFAIDQLELIYAHLISLNNIDALIARIT